jgi:hypothetical protein
VLAAVAGLTAVHVMLYATARHSYPVEPALILFAVSGWVAGRHAGRIPA